MSDFAIQTQLNMKDMEFITNTLKDVVVNSTNKSYNDKKEIISVIEKLDALIADFTKEKQT